MPVDSIATVLMWQAVNQLAKAMRSAVQAPNERTCAGRLGGWSGGGAGASWDGTATQWTLAWMSMPAACGCVTRSRSRAVGGRRFFGMRAVMAASRGEKERRHKRPRAREAMQRKQFLKRGHWARHQGCQRQLPGPS